MSIPPLVLIPMFASLFIIVFVIGLRAKLEDLLFLLRNPWLLIRSILAMNVIMLGFAVALSKLFDLDPAIKIALVALAVSPVPPLLPIKQIRAGGTASYAIGLLAAAGIVAIVLVPASIEVLELAFPFAMHISLSRVASIVALSIFVPLVAGFAVGTIVPNIAARFAPLLSKAGTIVLLVALVLCLVKGWSDFASLFGQGVVLCLVLFTAVGIAVGHLLGGPVSSNRTVLAIATGTRHPGVAIAIASLNFPDERAVLALVLYHLVVGAVVSFPYIRWRTRKLAAARN